MTGKEGVATRSSPRLRNRIKETNLNCHNIEPQEEEEERKAVHGSSAGKDDTSSSLTSCARDHAYVPQSLLLGYNAEPETGANSSALRTTTSRRGGKIGAASLRLSRVDFKKRERIVKKQQQAGIDESIERENKMKDFDQHTSVALHTPSTAAAAAAAAAKAFCDPSRGRYDLLSSRSYFDERQNVFRTHRDDGTSRITTKTRSDGNIRKPGMSFGNSTVRVMGSPTPTHISTRHYGLPRTHMMDHRYQSPSKSQAVFRKLQPHHPDDSSRNFQNADASPQQILLSLKSGSRSFELKSPGRGGANHPYQNHGDKSDTARGSQPHAPQSPQAPPEIQHSHHQMAKHEFLFDPKTPKTPKTPNIDFARNDNFQGTPSFSLFNQSFDSLVDASYLRSPNDQTLPVNFSLMDASPQKRSFMASPGSNFQGFSFTPTKQHTDVLEDFEGGSPGITLDNCMVDTIDDTPLFPRARKTATDALGGSDVVILEPNKIVRDIPTPTASNQSPRVDSNDIPLKKRNTAVSLEHGSNLFLKRSPNNFSDSDKQGIRGHTMESSGADPQEHCHPAKRLSRPEQTSRPPMPSEPMYGQAIPPPPHIYRSGVHPNCYQSKTKSTTLVGLTLDQIYERFSCHRKAFRKCCYLLPGFKAILGNSNHLLPDESKTSSSSDVVKAVSPERTDYTKTNAEDTVTDSSVIASRRIDSAICAFGGQVVKKESGAQSTTCYSNAVTNRYFEHESRISWDVEDSPPFETPRKTIIKEEGAESPMKRVGDAYDLNPKTPKTIKFEENADGANSNEKEDETSDNVRGEATRMKYRCKLCGKPKQNHKCPFQKSLQRSIGISVYPAVNAFAAAEPGNLAPALTEMNNFVREDSLPEITPSRPKRVETSIFRAQNPASHRSAPHVTPETMRSMKSPSSYGYPDPYTTNCSSNMLLSPMRNIRRRRILSPEKSTSRAQLCHISDLVFIESIPLREEQFRTVSSNNLAEFHYPCIPLPYLQRKTLSDNLFELSKELPTLKEECAIVLRQAREDDMWDVAVAELLTQMIVAIHCPPEDSRLEGLSRYLNSLGFAC